MGASIDREHKLLLFAVLNFLNALQIFNFMVKFIKSEFTARERFYHEMYVLRMFGKQSYRQPVYR